MLSLKHDLILSSFPLALICSRLWAMSSLLTFRSSPSGLQITSWPLHELTLSVSQPDCWSNRLCWSVWVITFFTRVQNKSVRCEVSHLTSCTSWNFSFDSLESGFLLVVVLVICCELDNNMLAFATWWAVLAPSQTDRFSLLIVWFTIEGGATWNFVLSLRFVIIILRFLQVVVQDDCWVLLFYSYVGRKS